jgi:hypothetical protein
MCQVGDYHPGRVHRERFGAAKIPRMFAPFPLAPDNSGTARNREYGIRYGAKMRHNGEGLRWTTIPLQAAKSSNARHWTR